jgi:hypothetical protein
MLSENASDLTAEDFRAILDCTHIPFPFYLFAKFLLDLRPGERIPYPNDFWLCPDP